ncbi:cytochrome B [bacterium F11]|nr:cytochrome B [bacterium F11]
MNWFRNLYKWVLHWADTPWGPLALFLLAFIESSIFPIPPDALLMVLCLGKPKHGFYFAAICTVGSVLGGMAGYFIGFGFWNISKDFFLTYIFSESLFYRVKDLYQQNAFSSVFISGFTPIPYKVFTIAAGVFHLSIPVFLIASILGRGMRFLLVALAFYFFGPAIKKIIDRYFEILTVLFSVLLIGGFIFIKWLLH